MKKKGFRILAAAAMALSISLSGCSGVGGDGGGSVGSDSGEAFDASKQIGVISREEGSGTRGAFIELLGIEKKNEDGTKKDLTTKEAVIANKTDVVMLNVAGDRYAIGYISLGSLNDTIKALKVEGVEATAANVKNGTYPIKRPFNIAYKGTLSATAQDFVKFILSVEGQAVVAKSYITIDDSAPAYAPSGASGKVVITGSSSVFPVMEKLQEAYLALNPGVKIELSLSDSSAGMKAAMDGICDIGMASRELKDTEKSALTHTPIALDGIAMIVNNANTFDNITKEQIKSIFIGETTKWNEVGA